MCLFIILYYIIYRQNKGRPKNIGSKERRRNGKRQRRLETVCCYGNGPERPVKSQRRLYYLQCTI